MAQHMDKASPTFHAQHTKDFAQNFDTIHSQRVFEAESSNSEPSNSWPGFSSSYSLSPTPILSVPSQRLDRSGAASLTPLDEALCLGFSRLENKELRPATSMDKSREHSSRNNKRATRRGPMDEMRQLVRILVKIIPQSSKNVKNCDEGGGGNRISEDQIKHYLASTLGDAPQPKWGVPDGWSSYLAELFSWVTCRTIRREEAARCAKREPGRSWEAIDSELANLGILPSTWPLPLSKDSMGSALVPAVQFQSSPTSSARRSGSAKRSADDSSGLMEGNGKRTRSDHMADELLDGANEVEAWQSALNAVNLAMSKAGSSDSLEHQMTVARLKAEILSKVQVPSVVPQPALLLGSQTPQLVPITVPGPNGQAQTAFTIQMQQLPLAPTSSLDLSSSLTGTSGHQPLGRQLGGSGAFQAVRPSSADCIAALQSSVLGQPPPLQLLKKNNSPVSSACEPESPFSDEAISSSFNGNGLTWAGSVSSPVQNLFKPTAIKKETGPSCSAYPSQDAGAKGCPEQGKCSSAFESLHNAAQLLSMSSNAQFCSQIQSYLQSQKQMQPIYMSQQVGKSC